MHLKIQAFVHKYFNNKYIYSDKLHLMQVFLQMNVQTDYCKLIYSSFLSECNVKAAPMALMSLTTSTQKSHTLKENNLLESCSCKLHNPNHTVGQNISQLVIYVNIKK